MFAPLQGREWAFPLWQAGGVAGWACVAAELGGFVFAWWARIHLGKLWSGAITLKPDHRVVEDGPYRLVRHPIYTGILLALYASLAMTGSLAGIAGAALMTAGFVWKARIEESWLAGELGSAYADYRRRVPMLVPFV
jgi:protein-S-isoprenylcysteine O-methyltransferase Ste14